MALPKMNKGTNPGAVAAATPAQAKVAVPGKKKAGVNVEKQILESTGFKYNAEQVKIGSKSDKLVYIEALGDPSEPDKVTLGKAGDKKEITYSRIIGYRFEVLEDMMVPDFGTTKAFNGKTLMNCADPNNWREAKAGETIELTRLEAGALLSKPEFAGQATGGEHHVKLSIAMRKVNLKIEDGVLRVENAKDLPNVSLIMAEAGASIKNLGIIDVLKYTSNVSKDSPYAEGTRELFPEFEGTKWAPRALSGKERRKSKRRSRGAEENVQLDRISAFSAMLHVMQNQYQG